MDTQRGLAPEPPEEPIRGNEAAQPDAPDPDSRCWCCGGHTLKRHCKIVCTNCGFLRDCSDP